MLATFFMLMSCAMVTDLPSLTFPPPPFDDNTPDFALHCNICTFEEPLTLAEAKRQTDFHFWQEAMNEEVDWCYQSTWDAVPEQSWMNLLTSKWVFKKKRDSSGAIDRYRARLCVRGFGQVPGVDFGDIFASVVRYTTIRILLTLCAHYGLHKTHLDAPKAFTQADLDTSLYTGMKPRLEFTCQRARYSSSKSHSTASSRAPCAGGLSSLASSSQSSASPSV
jgi:hypothetical protein